MRRRRHALDKGPDRGENYTVKSVSGIFSFPLGKRSGSRGFSWAGHFYFMVRLSLALLAAALVLPRFRPLVEWVLPVMGLRPIIVTMAGVIAAAVVHGVVRNPLLCAMLALAFLAVHFLVKARHPKRGRGRGKALLCGAYQWLLHAVPHLVFVLFFDAFLVAYYAFVRDGAAVLLLACAAMLFLAARKPLLLRMCSERGAIPAPGAWPAILGAAAGGGVLASLPWFSHAAVHTACAAVFVWALARLLPRLRPQADYSDKGTPVFNARLLVFVVLCFTALRGALWMAGPGRAPRDGLTILSEPGTVYDLLAADAGRSLVFSLKMPGRLGRLDVSTRAVTWSPDPRTRVLMRMAFLDNGRSLVVTTSRGLPVYNTRTLALERMLTRQSYDYLDATDAGDLIYATMEPAPGVFILDPHTGPIRSHTFGVPFLFWPYDVECAPDGRVFVSNWITSPMFIRLGGGRSGLPIKHRVHGFFNAGMALDPAGKRIFLARTFFRRIDVMDMDTLRVVDEIPSLFGIRELAFAPERNLLFAPSFFTGDVQIVDLSRRRYFVPFNAGRQVRSVIWEPHRKALYMGSKNGIVMLDWPALTKILNRGDSGGARAYSY